MPKATPQTETAVIFSNKGWPEQVANRAVERISQLEHFVDQKPVMLERLNLRHEKMTDSPFVADATMDISRRGVYAHVRAKTSELALQELEEELRSQIQDVVEKREHPRERADYKEPGEWRHGDLPSQHPDYWPRPKEERQVIERYSLASGPLTIDEAIDEMQSLGYQFHMFLDITTENEAVVSKDETGIHLEYLEGAPTLTLQEAIERLDTSGEDHVFFRNARKNRGEVLYRRYDGHYGLVT